MLGSKFGKLIKPILIKILKSEIDQATQAASRNGSYFGFALGSIGTGAIMYILKTPVILTTGIPI